ncbi:hypothetical protein [Clostridium sp.]|uniref:hypothetical protein n=1 Tax=Clostridium sp. TaxID=1506 RepID=UPI001B612176|nr:hypothetical protein [Clostridium sp.]MBP3917366.1 hypothetical protein [Clostridium sp.]
MGQYYKAVCIENKEYISSYDYGSGSKLMEHSYLRNTFVEAVARLLLKNNNWYKKRIVWAGDYGENISILDGLYDEVIKVKLEQKNTNNYYKDYKLEDIDVNIYEIASLCFEKISPFNEEESYELEGIVRYFYNVDKKEFIDINRCRITSEYGHIIHPLPLLTADGNGLGLGDYHVRGDDDEFIVGSWAGDRIVASYEFDNEYNDFTEIIPDFMETA